MVTVVKIDTFITLSASLALFGQLYRTKDVFKVSLEIQRAGACALVTSGECLLAASNSFRIAIFLLLRWIISGSARDRGITNTLVLCRIWSYFTTDSRWSWSYIHPY